MQLAYSCGVNRLAPSIRAPTPPAPPVPFTPETSGLVLFDSRDLADGDVSSWTSRGGRSTLLQGIAVNQPAKASSTVSFNGTTDIVSDTSRSFSLLRSHDLGAAVTNTGITRTPDGTWWIVNHPAGQTHSDAILTHYNAGFSEVLGTIDTAAIYGAGVTGGSQGIVYDAYDDTLWFTAQGADLVRHIGTDGTPLPADDIAFADPAGLAIDASNGHLIIMQKDTVGQLVQVVDKQAKTVISSGSMPQSDQDHIFFEEQSRTLVVTAGYQYSGGTDTVLVFYSMDGANFLTEIARVLVPEADAVEGVHFHGGKAFICNDAGFHAGASGKNEVLEFEVGQIFGTVLDLFGVVSWSGVTPTDCLIGIGDPVTSGEYGIAILPDAVNGLRIFTQSGGAGTANTTRVRQQFSSLPSFASDRILHCRIDTIANSVELHIDGVIQTVTTPEDLTSFLGPISDRARLNIGATHEGGSDKRHLSANVTAIGYGLYQRGLAGSRDKIEGWLAHEFALTEQLPDGHAFKTVAP